MELDRPRAYAEATCAMVTTVVKAKVPPVLEQVPPQLLLPLLPVLKLAEVPAEVPVVAVVTMLMTVVTVVMVTIMKPLVWASHFYC